MSLTFKNVLDTADVEVAADAAPARHAPEPRWRHQDHVTRKSVARGVEPLVEAVVHHCRRHVHVDYVTLWRHAVHVTGEVLLSVQCVCVLVYLRQRRKYMRLPAMSVCLSVCKITKQEVKVIWQKAPRGGLGGPIPRLGVTPVGGLAYGNALASINVVALRQTRLVLGWVTVCGRVNHLGQLGQLSLSSLRGR